MHNRKRLFVALFAIIALLVGGGLSYPLISALSTGATAAAPPVKESSYSDILVLLRGGDLRELTFYGQSSAAATQADGTVHRSLIPETVAADLAREAVAKGMAVEFKSEPFFPEQSTITAKTVLAIGGNLLVFAIIGAALYFFVFKGPLANRSKATLAAPGESTVRFADVAGCDGEKEELMEVVQFLRDPERFSRLGGKVPSGVLLSGPPGTGKTLLARAVAGEAGVPFFSISGSDFVEMYVGVGAQRVRGIFAKAKKKAPCILFVDEIDAVGRSRSSGSAGGAHEEREQTLNQLLVEMDGFKPNGGVIVVAATNRPEILDRALTRPGRFSRHIVLNNPDVGGRRAILSVHCRKVAMHPTIELDVIARGTPGFSGADLANLVNEAAIMAARRCAAAVSQEDFDAARDRILLGNERRSFIMSEEDRHLTAYHEAGHALVALRSPASDPIHKVTIVPRGQALGMVVRLPERDRPAIRRSKIEADLAVAMGGRAAEELIYGAEDVSTGASGDIQMATDLARRMVTEWGMSDKVGMVAYDLAHNSRIGGDTFSDATSREIDAEVMRLVARGRDRALAVLKRDIGQLHAVAQALLDRESLTGEEVAELAAATTGGNVVRVRAG